MNKTLNPSASLIGRWHQVSSESVPGPNAEVTMVFTPDGKLIYIVHDQGGKHIMNLEYEVAGDTIISDQPSEPRKEHTKFSFETDDILILEYGGAKTYFRRAS